MFEHRFDPYPWLTSARDLALAQERRTPHMASLLLPRESATTAASDPGDGIAWVPFVLGLLLPWSSAWRRKRPAGPPDRHAAGDLNACG